jgi:Domain of unknown function (DUF4328)
MTFIDGRSAATFPCMVGVQDLGIQQQGQFLPLRLLGNVLCVGMAVVIVVMAARTAIAWLSLGSEHWRFEFITLRLDKALDLTIFGWAVLFVVWFRRARINAERHGYRQRRARGWTFWGWIIPIGSLWLPFQLMGDIWRSGLPEAYRRRVAWLPAFWWTTWLLSGLSVGVRTMSANPGPFPRIADNTSTVSIGLLAISGALLIVIIRKVSEGPVGSPLPAPSYLS